MTGKKKENKKNITMGTEAKIVLILALVVAFIVILLVIIFIAGKVKLGMVEEQMNTEIGNTTADTFRASKKIRNADPYDNLVQLGTSVVKVPCELAVLLEEGVVISDETYTPQYLAEAGEQFVLSVDYMNMPFKLSVTNTAAETRKLYECTVIELLDISYYYVTFAGGISPGISTYDEVTELWGVGTPGSESSEDILKTVYYRDGVPEKDIYAYERGGTAVSDVSSIMDVSGYVYEVSYDRTSGIVTNITASFHEKSGKDVFIPITYRFEGINVTFDILKDAYDIGDDMLYCIENIDGVDYILGMGATDACYDESGTLLLTDANSISEKQLNQLTCNYLTYSDYDFSEDFRVINDRKSSKSYIGESRTKSVYFAVDAELREKEACSFAFYVHPINREDIVSDAAVEYMRGLIKQVRRSLIFS